MAELTDRLPGEIIFASYANEIRDRAVMRYVDVAARDASEPLPDTGELAYLTSTDELQVYTGTAWVNRLRSTGDTLSGALTWDDGSGPTVVVGPTEAPALRIMQSQVFPSPVNQAGGLRTQFSSGVVAMFAGDGTSLNDMSSVRVAPDPGGVVSSTLTVDGRPGQQSITADVPVQAADGDEAAPGFAFTDNPDDGMFRRGNTYPLGFATGGVERATVGNASVYESNNGSASTTIRNILVGPNAPDNGWGKDGDVYVRYTA